MRSVRVAREADVVVLRGIVMGYDDLASMHGDDVDPDVVAFVVPETRAAELDGLLAEIAREIALVVVT